MVISVVQSFRDLPASVGMDDYYYYPKDLLQATPDFSDVTDADQCKLYPDEWQIACLDAVIAKMDERMDEMGEDIQQLAQEEVSLVQLQMAGTSLTILLVLIGLLLFSCCCATRSDKRFLDGKSTSPSLPYVYL